jgi:uncharacterized protein YdhG (YjbR/CyaY superfamily)
MVPASCAIQPAFEGDVAARHRQHDSDRVRTKRSRASQVPDATESARTLATPVRAMSPPGQSRLRCVATTFATVDDYIASFPPAVREVLNDIRRTMQAVLPDAGETISYNIPTLTLDGRSLVYFAGWKRHVSVYPIPDGDDAYEAQLAPYRSGASTAKFPLDKPIPLDLVARITKLLSYQRKAGPAPSEP